MKLALPALLLAGIATAASAQYYTARGNFSSIGYGLDYDPSAACSKPIRPFSDDSFAWNNYRNDARRYLSCLESAANDDMRYAQRKIEEGYDEAVQEFLDEVERGY